MKKTVLAIVLAAATMPFTFAAQANKQATKPMTNPPATQTDTNAPKAKKHTKKHHRSKKGAESNKPAETKK